MPQGTRISSADIDLDALPPRALVVRDGQVTPIGKVVIAKVANDLAAACLGADDPQAAIELALQLTPKHMAEIASRHSNVEPSPLRGALNSIVGSECLERRPGRDALTGDRADGQPDTDNTWYDRLPCTHQHGHSDHHRDALGRVWQRAEILG
ncbi:hypothetical protein OG782_16745 [Streptomyces sp. NBC_00876]|uniref:hypothetical protein n=1 Tax=Streptomyces sp. NBC_00876 TaxID=2975853 RepID=UPI00386CBC48|nr:hypothetical protein OG782_16745 [Streptomyces sp. NBC_00876]